MESELAPLSEEQAAVMAAMDDPRPTLVTGKAGTGKSHLLKHLRKKFPTLAITASTGIAALNVEGQTLHSFAGLGMGQSDPKVILRKLRQRRGNRTIETIQRLEYLAIDEISMVGAELIDLVDGVFQAIRKNGLPFGGVKVIMFGDFLQLPPVRDEWAFKSKFWKAADVQIFILNKVFRQQDAAFADFLSAVREARWSTTGEIPETVRKTIRDRYKAKPDPEKPPVVLHTTNVSVDQMNDRMLDEVPGDVRSYRASETGPEWALEKMEKDCKAPKNLRAKVGARVMLLTNLDVMGGLANGSLGVVSEMSAFAIHVKFDNGQTERIEKHTFEIVDKGKLIAERRQFPLRLAWAITMHKSQGLTMDAVEVHMGSDFCPPGAAYVAMSRCRTLEGLFIGSTRAGAIKVDPEAQAFYDGPAVQPMPF
jgi:ATP-dependent DNA helicase PIF1